MTACRHARVSRCGAKASLLLIGLAISAAHSPAHAAVSRVTAVPGELSNTPAAQREVMIDTRNTQVCQQASIANAHCLGLDSVTAAGGRLAAWPGISWLLGAHGLDGSEQVFIIGDEADTRHAIAAILHLAGQADITLVDTPASEFLAAMDTAAGLSSGVTRSRVYTATMRSDQIMLTRELAEALQQPSAPTLLDGRSEAEYWGTLNRGPRGGHIPGATHWRRSLESAVDPAGSAVVYGANSIDSLALLGSLLPRMPEARVYIDGWAAWSMDSRLPVDAATYARGRTSVAAASSATPLPTSTATPSSLAQSSPAQNRDRAPAADRTTIGVLIVGLVGAAVLGFLGGRLGSATRSPSA